MTYGEKLEGGNCKKILGGAGRVGGKLKKSSSEGGKCREEEKYRSETIPVRKGGER